MRFSFLIVIFFIHFLTFSQKKEINFSALDSLYREDQFYLGLSYSNLQKTPGDGFDQGKLSPNVVLGFLRDMPINKNRTWAIAAGLGYRLSSINHNILISQLDNKNYYIISDIDFNKNKTVLHYAELPLEIRWRASTPESHKFWRIYTGFKMSYLFYDQYKFENSDTKLKLKYNSDLNKIQYGAYLTTGWNTWNAYVYYGFNPVFKSAKINEKSIDFNFLNVGLMFYIL